ncbi:malate transporter [Clostridia bacterium]|nr:malate transporter [Clostridia bacterium]
MFLRAIETVAMMIILMAVGAFFCWKGWLKDEGDALVSNLVVKAAMPGLIISNMLSSYTRESLISELPLVAPIFVAAGLCALIGYFVCKLKIMRIPINRQGALTSMFAFSNAVFIGYPVTRAVLGEEAIRFATLYYLANTILFWLIAAPLLMKDAGGGKVSPKRMIVGVLNAPLVTLFLILIMIMIGWTMPSFVMTAAASLGSLVTPLSMIFIGSMLYKVLKEGFKWERGFTQLIITRFVLFPLFTLLILAVFGVTGLARQTFFLLAGMSCMTQTAIVAHSSGADGGYASMGVALTTVMLLVMLPLYALILPMLA